MPECTRGRQKNRQKAVWFIPFCRLCCLRHPPTRICGERLSHCPALHLKSPGLSRLFTVWLLPLPPLPPLPPPSLRPKKTGQLVISCLAAKAILYFAFSGARSSEQSAFECIRARTTLLRGYRYSNVCAACRHQSSFCLSDALLATDGSVMWPCKRAERRREQVAEEQAAQKRARRTSPMQVCEVGSLWGSESTCIS
jgi:hypothetical protein